MIVDGPEIERPDGSLRCVGYGIDAEDRVTGRFALPSGRKWDAPDGTDRVEFVESIDALPPVDNRYPDPDTLDRICHFLRISVESE